MPNNHSVAKITGTGAPDRDIILKYADTIIGDLEILASADPFDIVEERDFDLTINGVISGAGDLVLERSGGFSGPDGVTPTDLITITGSSPNTITGTMRLYNSNGSSQPSYWVADKVGAFGQVSMLTLEGTAASGIASLRLTGNTIGGGGAISDSATTVYLGRSATLTVDAGVNEFIASGQLLTNLDGSGYTAVADGVYTKSNAAWIGDGDGTITVGIPEPAAVALLGVGVLMALCARRQR